MPIIEAPPEFDLNYYRNVYPELNGVPNEILTEHYKRFAVEQGRSTCSYDRREYLKKFLQEIIDAHNLKTLEISPWDDPFLRGDNVKYFDAADSETLRETAKKSRRANINNVPQKIDFISPNGDLSVINETFDIAFSSHVIEHTPDLIEHLRGVSKILNRGGLYILLVPDKRYCFDHYHSETTLAEEIDAFANERKNPRLADVFNLGFTFTHNNAQIHWLGIHGEQFGYRKKPLPKDLNVTIDDEIFTDDVEINFPKLAHFVDKYSETLARGKYISTHNWRFTPENFGYIIKMLNQLSLINLQIYRLCHTIWGRLEFVAMLEKN